MYLLPAVLLGLLSVILLNLWAFWDVLHFTRIENDTMKRGVVIERHPLAWKTYQLLFTMPNTILHFKQHFLRKKNNEVLVVPEAPIWWKFWGIRGTDWPYAAYVNLSNVEHQVEFRVPLTRLFTLAISGITMMVPLLFFYMFAAAYNLRVPTSLWLLTLVIVLIMSISSVFVYHYRRRKLLLQILEQAMGYYEEEV